MGGGGEPALNSLKGGLKEHYFAPKSGPKSLTSSRPGAPHPLPPSCDVPDPLLRMCVSTLVYRRAPAVRASAESSREAEVRQLDVEVAVHEQVLALDVSCRRVNQ